MTLFSSCTFRSCTSTSLRAVDERSHTKLRSIALPTLLTVPCRSRCSDVSRCSFSLERTSNVLSAFIWPSDKLPDAGAAHIVNLHEMRVLGSTTHTHTSDKRVQSVIKFPLNWPSLCMYSYEVRTYLSRINRAIYYQPASIALFRSSNSFVTSLSMRSECPRIAVNLVSTRSNSLSTAPHESFLSMFSVFPGGHCSLANLQAVRVVYALNSGLDEVNNLYGYV